MGAWGLGGVTSRKSQRKGCSDIVPHARYNQLTERPATLQNRLALISIAEEHG